MIFSFGAALCASCLAGLMTPDVYSPSVSVVNELRQIRRKHDAIALIYRFFFYQFFRPQPCHA